MMTSFPIPVLASRLGIHDGKPAGEWEAVPGANPLWQGPAAYSTLAVRGKTGGGGTFFVVYERGVQSSNEVLRLTELPLPY